MSGQLNFNPATTNQLKSNRASKRAAMQTAEGERNYNLVGLPVPIPKRVQNLLNQEFRTYAVQTASAREKRL